MQNLYEAILGDKNRIYYLTTFESFDSRGRGLWASWNWPAFFVSGTWALYRKMYGWCFADLIVHILATILDKTGSPALSFIVYLVSSSAFAILANSLYHNNIRTKIAEAQFTVNEESKLLEYLRYKGGVHTWVIWVSVGLPVIVILAVAVSFADIQVSIPQKFRLPR